MRHSKLVEYRKQEIGRLLVLGHNQAEIAKLINVAQPTVSRDITAMQETAKEDLKKHVEKVLPHVQLLCNRGIDQVLKTAWTIVGNSKNDYVKIHALNLIHQAYITKQNLSADGTVINNAMELMQKSKKELQDLQSGNLNANVNFGEVSANLAALGRARDARRSAITSDMSGLGMEEGNDDQRAIVIGASQSAQLVEEAQKDAKTFPIADIAAGDNTSERRSNINGLEKNTQTENDSQPERIGQGQEGYAAIKELSLEECPQDTMHKESLLADNDSNNNELETTPSTTEDVEASQSASQQADGDLQLQQDSASMEEVSQDRVSGKESLADNDTIIEASDRLKEGSLHYQKDIGKIDQSSDHATTEEGDQSHLLVEQQAHTVEEEEEGDIITLDNDMTIDETLAASQSKAVEGQEGQQAVTKEAEEGSQASKGGNKEGPNTKEKEERSQSS